MPTVGELKAQLEDTTTLKLIATAFTEAAAARVGKIKKDFERNSQFYTEISHLYHVVQLSKIRDEKNQLIKTDKKQLKELAVAVTSNQRFYGNLNINIMTEYIKDTKDKNIDRMVIGSTGRDYLKSSPDFHFEYFAFVHDLPSTTEANSFLDKVMVYDRVVLYFPKFVSLVTQKVGIKDITETLDVTVKDKEEELNILFEPDLSLILDFFKRQVRSLLFWRVILETDLSRTAARLITMSSADERSTEMLKVTRSQLRKIQSSVINAKLLETFAAMKGARKR